MSHCAGESNHVLRFQIAMKATIVVPCYNEAKRLHADVFLKFVEKTGGVHFLFVNDGSTDNTLQLLHDLEARSPARVSVLSLQENSGKAEAVRRGMLAAMNGGAHYAGFWDADLATPLEEINEFRDLLNHMPATILVMGSRVVLLGRRIERRVTRQILGRAFAFAASRVLRLKVYDTQCGAKMFRVSPIVKQLFSERFCSRWIFDVELIARIIAQSHQGDLPQAREIIYENPLRTWTDVKGSNLKVFDFFRAFNELMLIYRKYRRQLGPHTKAKWSNSNPRRLPSGSASRNGQGAKKAA